MSKKNTILVSKLLPPSMEEILETKGYRVIRLTPTAAIKSELRFHPDVLCCKTPTGLFIGDPIIQAQMSDLVDFGAFKYGKPLQDGYPYEVLYNCYFYGKYLFASRYTDKVIFQHAADNGFQPIIVKQGYTKCSVAICGKDSFITADKAICSELEKIGFNVLLINGSDILLNGFSCGFIGGCFGLLDDDLVAFTGSLDCMLDGRNIKSFLSQIGTEILELSKDTLYDYGGFILI